MRREDEILARFVNPSVLPPLRYTTIQMEPGADPPLHMGSQSISGISAVTIGSCFINTIEFIYPWNTTIRVNSVPVGERFDFVVNYQAENLATELPGIGFWSMCIVFWDDEGDIEGYYFKNTAITSATKIEGNIQRIANNTYPSGIIMPNHPVTLHFNMFINDDATPAQQYPARVDWGK